MLVIILVKLHCGIVVVVIVSLIINVVYHMTVNVISGRCRGVAWGAVAPPPFLPSQEIQNNECIDIKTQ